MKQVIVYSLIALIGLPSVALAEVVVKKEPMTWEKSALLPGNELYQNLCATCHGVDGTGNGVAAVALEINAPDLTLITRSHEGIFPRKKIKKVIAGNHPSAWTDESPMPAWEGQFMYAKTGLSSFQREAYARNRIHALTVYLEDIQGH